MDHDTPESTSARSQKRGVGTESSSSTSLVSAALRILLNYLLLLKTVMTHSDNQYSKLRWLLTIAGLVLYVVDIWTDSALVVKYFLETQYIWTGLTLAFVITGQTVTQTFSFAWYSDDMEDALINPEGKRKIAGLSRCKLMAAHLCGGGIFIRYYHLLKRGYKAVWAAGDGTCVEHHSLFCLATDLSMLKLFEAFMESVPQLLLQLYILLGRGQCSVMQYVSVSFSFLNTAWALVDYRRCLRRSLPHVTDMPSGLPTLIYLLYKLGTITSHILSYGLLLLLSTYSAAALAVLWLLGTTWAHWLKTNFCSSQRLELLYRAVVGVILTFTYFNVKGQNMKVEMISYYVSHAAINVMAPTLLFLLQPDVKSDTLLLTVSGLIVGGSLLGLVCLVSYYLFLHPKGNWREADEVDGTGRDTGTSRRIRNFLQP
ncbi:XK-related protein 9 [Betta splendens]|uniref:XK-related protein n=1 Tax=Betta splendens TaxID=158456 RepID=A0A6P7MCS8_BETSP|nr:XK-related protein 9 [Betta splendens]